jgi:hypothetical protein
MKRNDDKTMEAQIPSVVKASEAEIDENNFLDDLIPSLRKAGGTDVDILYLNKLSELLDKLIKTHFTYKKMSESTDSYDYQVYFNGEPFMQYGAPFEKVVVMLVDALERGYRTGGQFVLNEMLDTIKKRK